MTVELFGEGLSSFIAQACLLRQGIGARIVADAAKTAGPRPILVLNTLGQTLLAEIFPDIDWSQQGYRLQQREVLWGYDPRPSRILEPALVLRQESLGDVLRTAARRWDGTARGDAAEWCVNPPDQDDAGWLRGGDRVVVAAPVTLATRPNPPRTVMESLSGGWLHLAPTGPDHAVVQVMLAKPPDAPEAALRDALAQSVLIGPAIAELSSPSVFPAAAAIRLPAIDPPQLAMGSRVIRFDPVSGEGAPLAIQGAILAAAVIGQGGGAGACLHYTHRLVSSFLAHLEGCLRFYRDAFSDDPGWRDEIAQMQGLSATLAAEYRQLLERPYRYHLEGVVLNPINDNAAVFSER